jgi:vancomycin resistance protein YoaR
MSNISATRPTNTQDIVSRSPSISAPILNAFLSICGGFLLLILMLTSSWLTFESNNEGLIFPGVSIGGIDVSGMTPAEAAAIITIQMDFPTRGQIVFQDSERMWVAKPNELGLHLDPQSTILAAYLLGREGNFLHKVSEQFSAWYNGVDLAPVYVYDERTAHKYLEGIASEINRPVIEAAIWLEGTEVKVTHSQIGRSLDTQAALSDLQGKITAMADSLIPLVVVDTAPVIVEVSETEQLVKKILSEPLVIRIPDAEENDPGPWIIEPSEVAAMLTIERIDTPDASHYRVSFDSSNLRSHFERAAPLLARSPEDARLIFNDDTHELEVIKPAITGRTLEIGASLQHIQQKALEGEHQIDLVVNYAHPDVGNDATGEQFGIRELVSVHTSYFYGSSAGRIRNIQIASARFHGVMVPPGATFSMAEVLGNITFDEGYEEAWIIYGGRTIKGIGGGVCQVSTTLFRTAFYGGFPIVERYPHAYRVGYYEQRPGGGYDPKLAGLDATVFVPVVDFKFKNDTPYWLLMETYVNAANRTLTWKFYSTSDGRTVEVNSSGLKNVVKAPPPLYEENPDLKPGEINQVDWAADGAEVTVTRIVTRNGETLYNTAFTTKYQPWRAIYHYGPGTEGMPPESPPEEP